MGVKLKLHDNIYFFLSPLYKWFQLFPCEDLSVLIEISTNWRTYCTNDQINCVNHWMKLLQKSRGREKKHVLLSLSLVTTVKSWFMILKDDQALISQLISNFRKIISKCYYIKLRTDQNPAFSKTSLHKLCATYVFCKFNNVCQTSWKLFF